MHKKILLPALVLFSSLALVAVPLSFSETPSRPNEQAPSGIDPYNITCKNAYQLMIKTFDGKPICVMEKSVARLSAIGFATAAGDKSYDIKFKVIRDLFEVDSNAPEKLQTALEIREFLESSQNKIHVNEMLSGNYITLDSHSGFRESGLADGLWEESLSLQPSIPQASPKAWEIGGDGPVEYSTTNIQVKNVDEPDFVKNDAFNIYVLGDDKLATVKAFPPSGAALLSKIGIGSEQSLDTMLLSGDRLILFSENPQHTSATDVFILDMDDKENPQIMRSFSITGAYVEARMIEDHVYLLTSSDLNPDDIMMPEITDSLGMSMDSDVFYFPHDMHHRYVFNTITAFDTVGDTINSESYIMGDAGGVYVSEKNMYITYINIYPEFILNPFGNDEFFDSVLENLSITEQFELLLLSSAYEDNIVDANRVQTKLLDLFLDLYERLDRTQQEKIISKLLEDQNVTNHRELHNPKTIIHKISLDGTSFTHESTGAVPGHPINQFAMDEFDNRFRIATTDKSWKLTNAVYNLY